MTPTEQFPLLFLTGHATVKSENLSDIKVRLSAQYTKINSEWIIDISAKSKTIKEPEKNIGENLCDLGLGKCLLAMTPKAQSIKKKKLINWTTSKLKTIAL